MNSHYKWLHQQLDSWIGDNLINSQQANSLRLRYPLGDERNWGKMVIPTPKLQKKQTARSGHESGGWCLLNQCAYSSSTKMVQV